MIGENLIFTVLYFFAYGNIVFKFENLHLHIEAIIFHFMTQPWQ